MTPHPRILGVLGDIEFAHWQCLAELIDNSFDEFQSAGNTTQRPSVTIALPAANAARVTAEIIVQDNGRGMTLDAVTNAISAGWTSNGRHGALGLFGMGFNISTARLGRRTTVRTARAGDPEWIEVTLDLPAIAESSRYKAPIRRVPKTDPAEHGTTVTISDLKSDQFEALRRPQTQGVIRDKLGDVYSYLLSERGFLLTINGKKVKPRLPCVWDESRTVTRQGVEIHALQRVDQQLTAKKVCMACGYWSSVDADKCEECGRSGLEKRERRIWGWIGVQRYVHRTDYGLDFLRNGRKILLKDKKVFYWQDDDELAEPELEYPIDSKTPTGRIVGEIHCDHVTPNYQKTAFEFETHEWRQVLRAVRGTSPLRPKIAKRLELPENRSPLGVLYAGFRRQDPGLNYLVPGDGRNALHERAAEWAALFRAGNPDYLSDEVWYRAAYLNDNPVTPEPPAESDDILPGFGSGLLGSDGEQDTETQPAEPTDSPAQPEPTPAEETLEERLQRYRDHADPIVDLEGDYLLADLGRVQLSAWAVRGQAPLIDRNQRPAPVVAVMLRAPALEVFVDVSHRLFREYGADMRDVALVEVAEFMRSRADDFKTPMSEVISQLKASTGSARLTPSAIADEAEGILDRVRSAMVTPVSVNAAVYWTLLSADERAAAERRYAMESSAASSWNEAIRNGEFVRYVPASAIVRMVQEFPGAFLDGHVFKRPYTALTDSVAQCIVVERLINPLAELALMEQHRPKLDQEELTRIRVSCRLVTRDIADGA